jgi:hypothetical protein
LTAAFACPGGLSFAFMNFSKLSNETDFSAKLNLPAVTAFLECSQGAGTNFFNREISILEPDLIITMNLNKWLAALGEYELVEQLPKVERLRLKAGGRSIPLLNTYHFSALKKDQDDYYDPVLEAWKSFQADS